VRRGRFGPAPANAQAVRGDLQPLLPGRGHRGGSVRYEDSSGEKKAYAADCVLNATGRAPVVGDLGLAEVGVDFSPKGVRVTDQGKTNVPGVWACGDVTGQYMLAHVATREGIVAVNSMFGRPDRARYDAVPAVIYTHPEVASAGRTEEQLKAAGIAYVKAMVPMGWPGGSSSRTRRAAVS